MTNYLCSLIKGILCNQYQFSGFILPLLWVPIWNNAFYTPKIIAITILCIIFILKHTTDLKSYAYYLLLTPIAVINSIFSSNSLLTTSIWGVVLIYTQFLFTTPQLVGQLKSNFNYFFTGVYYAILVQPVIQGIQHFYKLPAMGSIGNPDFLGTLFLLGLAISLSKKSPWWIYLWIIMGILMTGSILTIGYIIISLAYYYRHYPLRVVTGISIALFATSPHIWVALQKRIMIWLAAIYTGKLFPLTGAGLGQFRFHYLQGISYWFTRHPQLETMFGHFTGDVNTAHNFLLHLWAETGMLGIVGLGLLLYQLKHRISCFNRHQQWIVIGLVFKAFFTPVFPTIPAMISLAWAFHHKDPLSKTLWDCCKMPDSRHSPTDNENIFSETKRRRWYFATVPLSWINGCIITGFLAVSTLTWAGYFWLYQAKAHTLKQEWTQGDTYIQQTLQFSPWIGKTYLLAAIIAHYTGNSEKKAQYLRQAKQTYHTIDFHQKSDYLD